MKRILTVACLCLLAVGLVWAQDVDILTKIHTVFVGDYSREAIQQTLDDCITLYDLEPGDTMYEKVASMALSLRKSTDVEEMKILACTNQLRQGENPLSIKVTEAAALCATLLSQEPPTHAQVLQLQARIAQLEKQVEALQAQLAAVPTPKPKPKAPEGIPEDIDAQICQLAAEKHPDKSSTQLYFIERERQAWLDLQVYTAEIPAKELERLRQVAAERFPVKFSTQLYYIEREVKAYQELHP